MKRTGLILLTILSIASCSHTRDLDIPEAAQDAVGFDVYTRSTVSTKAGFTGDIDEASFKVAGFGVYAYVGTTPDFMRNQHVTYSGGSWVYSPLKYWPNQDTDKIDFFAYAPHIAAAPYTSTADALANANDEDGILYIPGTDATGDPVIVYKTATDPSNSVDLMFGVAAEDHASPDVTAGLPFLIMTKLKLGEKMKFNFKHALTKLVVNVDGYFDEENSGSGGNHEVDANTRIVVESVRISTDQLATYGTLNLKNTEVNTPKWELGTTSTTLSAYPLPVASNLLYIDGNESSVVHFSQQPLGVTKTKQSLMGYGIDGTTAASLMFVPNAVGTGNLDVTIVYHVITRDARLETGYSDVTNTITKTITGLTGNAFKPGYLTTLTLHLGLASVRFDADITDWETGETEDADLPVNESRTYYYSISDTKKVEIAPSNLMFQGDGVNPYPDGGTWSLMEHPWTIIETNTTSPNGYPQEYGYTSDGIGSAQISLFAWGTSGIGTQSYKYPWNTNDDNNRKYGPASGNILPDNDWGANTIVGLDGTGWRIPSRTEWQYLCGMSGESAEKRGNQFGLGKIGDVCGLFLLPDKTDWEDPQPSGKTFTQGYLTNFTKNNYTIDEWKTLSIAGFVFLPASGFRQVGTSLDVSYKNSVKNVNSGGSYWSSERWNIDYAWKFTFSVGYTNYYTVDTGSEYKNGCSVRLIREVE